MKVYKRLNIEEREEISRLLALGTSMRGIARALQRSPSTISREIWRTDVKGKWRYRAIRAEKRAFRNAKSHEIGMQRYDIIKKYCY